MKELFTKFIGQWAYFIGSVMADGFHERMIDLERDEMEMDIQEPKGEDEGKWTNN